MKKMIRTHSVPEYLSSVSNADEEAPLAPPTVIRPSEPTIHDAVPTPGTPFLPPTFAY